MKEALEIIKQVLTYMASKHSHYSEMGCLVRLLLDLPETITTCGPAKEADEALAHYNYEELAKLDRKTQEAAYPLRQ